MTLLKYVGYVLFFLGSFVVSLYLTFPWNAAKDRVLDLVGKQIGAEVTAGRLEPSWITGVEARDLKIRRPTDTEPIVIDQILVRAKVLELITGNKGATIRAPLAGGKLDVDVVVGSDTTSLVGDISGIELALVPGLKDAIGIPLGGKISATSDLHLGTKDPKTSSGKLNLKGAGLEILKGGKMSGFPLPELAIGNFDWNLTIKDGKALVEKQKVSGENLELELDGEIALLSPPSRSTMNLAVSFKPTDAFLKKEPLLGALLNNIKNARGSDGFYTYAITGTVKHPRFFARRR